MYNRRSIVQCTLRRKGLMDSPIHGYDPSTITYLRITYVIGAIIWLVIIWMLSLWRSDAIGIVIVLVPFILFIIAIYMLPLIERGIEDSIFKTNYLSLGIVVVLPLFTSIRKDIYGDDAIRFSKILVLSLLFSMISMIDVWTNSSLISITKHIRSIIQTYSIVLLMYALYMYYARNPINAFT